MTEAEKVRIWREAAVKNVLSIMFNLVEVIVSRAWIRIAGISRKNPE